MSSRDNILHRIRTELSKGPAVTPPPVPEVWPRTDPPPAALAERFTQELQAVHGEVIRAASIEEARRQLCQLIGEAGWTNVGAVDRPLVREAAAAIPAERVAWTRPDWQPREMAELSVGLVEAECLLADTGSCAIVCRTGPERLMCYLPPACIVLAHADRLAEHLPAAWPRLSAQCADPQRQGELVIVTGPSRTSDIEKVLILGVHGPKRLVVIVVG